MKKVITIAIAALFALVPQSMSAQAKWDSAAANIVRVLPGAFTEVPADVRSALHRLGCTIPQAWGNDHLHNIVSGSFAQRDQTDWAALCSSDGSSAIHIIWGGDASCPTPIAPPVADRIFLQDTGLDGVLFSRGISRVRPDPKFWTVPEGFAPDSAGHDAISDAFYEKGAVAYYCESGSWVELVSGD